MLVYGRGDVGVRGGGCGRGGVSVRGEVSVYGRCGCMVGGVFGGGGCSD